MVLPLRTVLLLSLGGVPARAAAQLDTDHAVWTGAAATQELVGGKYRLALWLDVHRRQGTSATTMIIRPGVGLVVDSWLSFWAGYAWTPAYPDGAARRDEHRLWTQVWVNRALGKGFAFQSRSRLEHRFAPRSGDVAHRFRQFVRLGFSTASHPLGFVVWDELFVGLADAEWGAVEGYDQNRLFVGPVLRIAPWARVEAGYLLVHLDREPNRLVHAVAVNLFFAGTTD